jgi:glycosyltransferase involved in cell wall biosynthesis
MRVTLAIPCFNEEAVIENTVTATLDYAAKALADFDLFLVIVDNGSTDGTEAIGRRLEQTYPDQVSYRRLHEPGKGRAIRVAWKENPADIYAFMDADLATDLAALPLLLTSCAASGGLTIGSRHLPQSKVKRSALRRLFSFGYRWLLNLILGTHIKDLPCGFKAASVKVIKQVLPQVRDNAWFFDSELVIRTEHARLPVTEIPVAWQEPQLTNRQSKVPLLAVAANYIKLAWRLRTDLRRNS